jgi:hypothetical protein
MVTGVTPVCTAADGGFTLQPAGAVKESFAPEMASAVA